MITQQQLSMRLPSLLSHSQSLFVVPVLRTTTTSTTALMMAAAASSAHPGEAEESGGLSSPRTQSVLLMAIAMAFHFGGYEFVRNACLALFTSAEYGFVSPSAFPLANALVSPFSVLLLWGYSQQLERYGPRITLRHTTVASLLILAAAAVALHLLPNGPPTQLLLGVTFLFQNSYQYLLYTQQWSFVSSVLTVSEGSAWFPRIAGFSSLVCSVTGSLVPFLVPVTGLLGLMALTSATLLVTTVCQDKAYALAQKHDFDPSESQPHKKIAPNSNRVSDAVALFQRTPTLTALLKEVLSFQCLNTILNVAFVGALKTQIRDDALRSSYASRLYAWINGISALLQFFILPTFMKRTEPVTMWRWMPLVPLVVCAFQEWRDLSLPLLATAFGLAKVMDYSVRSVVYPMVYQPLDFEARYVGKEIIGVLGSRFGKSGMSLILSLLTSALGDVFGFRQLVHLSVLASSTWLYSAWGLSRLLPRKAQAEEMVESRQQHDKKHE